MEVNEFSLISSSVLLQKHRKYKFYMLFDDKMLKTYCWIFVFIFENEFIYNENLMLDGYLCGGLEDVIIKAYQQQLCS